MRTKPQLLIVDEDELFAGAAHARLESAGYAVTTAADGPAALELAGRLRPNLVVVEMILPGCSGFQVLKQLADRPSAPQTVMLASIGGSSHRELARCLGAAEFLTKPVSLNRLTEIINRLTPVSAPPLNPPHLSPALWKSVEAHAGS